MNYDPGFPNSPQSSTASVPPPVGNVTSAVEGTAFEEQPTPQIDRAKAAELFAELVAKQNLLLAIIGGFVASLVGAGLWALITVMTRYQIGYMAIGVGFLVAMAVRGLGKGLTKPFGIVGAAFALFGCLLGNLLAVCGMAAIDAGEPVLGVTLSVLIQPTVMVELMQETFSPMDLLFYGFAVYEGYKLSFRQVTDEELASMVS